MSSNWETLKVQDILYTTDYVANGSFASIKENVKYLNKQDYAVLIRLVDFNSGWNGDFVYVDKKSYDFLKKSYVEPKDVIISNVGANVGTVFQAPNLNQPMTLGPNSVLVKPAGDNIDRDFVYYFFTSPIGQSKLSSIVSGSAQPKFNKTDLRNIDFPLPPLPIQKKIAHILSTLDDKIELNRKMNQTLESMASAIFKSWFVDFDPVHAKANCESEAELENIAKELGISKEILDLFPSEFEESELGMIPKGWKNDYIDTFVEILDSKRVPLASNEREKIKGDIPYYGATSIMGYVNDYIFDEILLLMGEDGSVVRDDGTPFLQYIWGKSWVNNHAHVMKSKSTLSVEALYIALINKNVTMFVTGAVQPKINQGNLKQIPIINAGEVINTTFSNLIEPIFAKIRLISEENTSLQKTRDTLLPKLLSGEIDVSELEIL